MQNIDAALPAEKLSGELRILDWNGDIYIVGHGRFLPFFENKSLAHEVLIEMVEREKNFADGWNALERSLGI